MRIAALFNPDIANGRYRGRNPLRQLERRGHKVLWPGGLPNATDVPQVPDCDLALIHRFDRENILELVLQLRERGIAVVWDNDDDMSALDRSTRKTNGRSKRQSRKDYERSLEIARQSHLVTTPSAELAERYRAHGAAHVAVIENALTAADLIEQRPRHQGLVIGWAGASEHLADLKRLPLARILHALLEEHAGVRVVSLGAPLKIEHPRYEAFSSVPIEELTRRESEFDIGIAPLLDTPFNRARSNVKLKEYASAGAMWLASPVGPYLGLGEQQGGQLVADDDWHHVLTELIVDYRRRTQLTERARAWARSQTIERIGATWEQAFRDAVRRAAAPVAAAG